MENCELVILIPSLGKLMKYLARGKIIEHMSREQPFEENSIQISLKGDLVSPGFQNSPKAGSERG